MGMLRIALAVGLLASLGLPAAEASYPGRNGLIAFDSSAGSKFGTPAIFTMRADGTGRDRITERGEDHSFDARDAAWSRSGKRIAYSGPGPKGRSIYIARPDGSGRRTLPLDIDATDPAWSPGGRYLAFTHRTFDEEGFIQEAFVYTVRKDGKKLRRLAEGGDPSWSPDGRWIAFGFDEGDCGGVYLMRPDGSGRHRVLPQEAKPRVCRGGFSPDFSPSGRRIAFANLTELVGGTSPGFNIDIFTIKVNGTGLRRLTRTAGLGSEPKAGRSRAHETDPVWSPDGRKILYHRYGFAESKSGAFLMNTDGSRQRRLSDACCQYAWQPRPR